MKSLSQLLIESSGLFLKTFLKLLGATLSYFGCFVLSLIAILVVGVLSMFLLSLTGWVYTQVVLGIVIGILVISAIAILSFMYMIGIIKIIQSENTDQNLTINEAFKESWVLLNPTAWIALLAGVKVILWSLLLIIPGVFFAIYYSFSLFSFLIDGKRGIEALVFSKSMVKANIGKFVGNLLTVNILGLVFYLIFKKIISLTFGIPDKMHGNFLAEIGGVIGIAISVFIQFYQYAFSYLLYEEIKKPVTPISLKTA